MNSIRTRRIMVALRAPTGVLDPLFLRGLARLVRLLHLLHGLADLLLGLLQGFLGLFEFLLLERSGGGGSARCLDSAAGEGRGRDDGNEPCHGNSFRCGGACIGYHCSAPRLSQLRRHGPRELPGSPLPPHTPRAPPPPLPLPSHRPTTR